MFLGPYPALEDLIIRHGGEVYWAECLLPSIQTAAPKLQNFELGLLACRHSWSPDSVGGLWRRIRSIILTDSVWTDSILSQCSCLTHFKQLSGEWPKHDTDKNLLVNIQSLDLQCDPRNLCRLYMPSLQRLVVYEVFDKDACEELEPFELPYLTSLHAKRYDLAWITCILAPRLRELEVDIHRPNRMCANCHDPTYPDLEESSHSTCILNLTLWNPLAGLSRLTLNSNCSETAYISIIDTVTQAQKLNFSPLVRLRDQNAGLKILERLAHHSELGRFTQLEIFILGRKRKPFYSLKEELGSRIIPFVESRKQMGKELVQVDVYWSDGLGNHEPEILQYAM